MTKVLISGSMSIKYKDLPSEVFASLDRIMAQGFEILIGDAPGVDSGIQWYLQSRNYTKVTVYYSIEGNRTKPRNNWGFETVGIVGSYGDRDKAMCEIADYGLAIWNGHSRGTAGNIRRVPKTRVVKIEQEFSRKVKVRSPK
jgi:adenine-specific DNA-methyltransferase